MEDKLVDSPESNWFIEQPMNSNRHLTALAPLLFSLGITPAIADFSDDFSSGSLVAYNLYNPLGNFGTPATYSFVGGGLQVQTPQSAVPSIFGPGRGGLFVAGQTYSNFSVSYDISSTAFKTPQYVGAFVQANNLSLGNLTAFTVGVDYSDSSFLISKVVGEQSLGSIAPTANSGPLTLIPGDVLHVDYSYINGEQSAILTDKTLGKVLATVHGSDSSFVSGSIGLGVAIQSGAAGLVASGTFGQISVTSVPEPSTWGLAAIGLAGLWWMGRRRQA